MRAKSIDKRSRGRARRTLNHLIITEIDIIFEVFGQLMGNINSAPDVFIVLLRIEISVDSSLPAECGDVGVTVIKLLEQFGYVITKQSTGPVVPDASEAFVSSRNCCSDPLSVVFTRL
jgi:hypothetical protein